MNQRIEAMREGGKRLAKVKEALVAFTHVGTTFEAIEAEANRLIKLEGATANFATVEDYHWATCIMKNDELCHGIPVGKKVEDGDVITIDVGLLYQGFHLDTSTTFLVGQSTRSKQEFLEVGRAALRKAIERVKPGISVYEISKAMEKTVSRAGYGAVYQLTGHGIGEELHMEPNIPCVAYERDKRIRLTEGQTVAIEIMYTAGDPELTLDDDGWTYRTKDGSLAGMFEETVLVTKNGFEILTK
jgi:methionyl aminopeptidase